MAKLFVFDVDGTLLNPQNQVLESSREALRLLAQRGHKVMLATGRGPVAMEPIWPQLGGKMFYIGFNGAVIMDGETIVYEETIPPAGVEEAVELARQFGLSINVYSGLRWLIEKENPLSKEEGELVQAEPEVGDLSSVDKIHKILVLGTVEEVARYRRELRERSKWLNVTISLPTYCEVVSHQVSKGQALKRACTYLGIDPADTVAFGDGENDLELFAAAGLKVAMGNAHPALRAAADYVTDSNDEDGVLKGVLWALAQLERS
ncbi:MAG: HAD family hydrolase [Firmicutes bacterium]|nr:HAD family hydrolase [Bacillota bacterium]